MTLKSKLIFLFIGFIVVPLALFGAVVFSQARTILQSVRIAQLNNIADLKKDKIETFFEERRWDLASAQHVLSVRQTLPVLSVHVRDRGCAAYARAKREMDGLIGAFMNHHGYLDVMLTDARGTVVYENSEARVAPHVGKTLPLWAAYVEEKKGVYFTDILVNRERNNRYEMFALAPIEGEKGAFLGAVVIEIDMDPVYRFILESTGLGQSGEVLIARREGESALFLSPLRRDPDAAFRRRVAFDEKISTPSQMAVQKQNGSGKARDYYGKEVLAAWRYIPALRWGLVTEMEVGEAFAAIDHARNLTLMVGMIVVFLGAIAALSIARAVTGPVRVLQKGAEAIAAGDLFYRVDTGKQDEIGRLSRSFDTMAEALIRDRDARTEAEKNLQHHVCELQEVNRELEAFSYSVSHDLRSPLRSMDGFSLALLEDYEDRLDDTGRDYLQRVRAASQRMSQLIDDLLNLSRVTRCSISRAPVDLSRTAADIAAHLKQTAPDRGVRFVIAGGLETRGDERLLRIALENLLNNAWKFTAGNPAATIEFGATKCGMRNAECGIKKQTDLPQSEIIYFVRDDGVGFDMAYVHKLFGPFQRLHSPEEFPGTGIGLATVQRVINRHGGKAWIEGKVGKGTTVYFTLGERQEDAASRGSINGGAALPFMKGMKDEEQGYFAG